ncbi:MAG: sensor histidine kinase [Spirochaetales bacterium]|nr:sensor histidine kinase [Spirochaetales bacterium]
MEVETALNDYIADGHRGELLDALGRFREKTEAYFESPYYRHYEGSRPKNTGPKDSRPLTGEGDRKTLNRLFEAFSGAITQDNREGVLAAAVDIRNIILKYQTLETETSDAVFAHTFYFFAIFIVIIFILMLIIWLLQRNLSFSRRKERDSSNFSRQIMAAQETERTRIAAELHDTVLQDLSRLTLMTKRAAAMPETGEILAMENRIMLNCRGVCERVMPPDFSRLSLEDSLTALCINMEEKTGIKCRTGVQKDLVLGGLGPEKQLHCYRMVQEAMTNIEKHAGAREAVITMRNGEKEGAKTLLLFVSDDGKGMEKEDPRIGIRGMRERAAFLKGELSFANGGEGKNRGLTIRIEIPLEENPP